MFAALLFPVVLLADVNVASHPCADSSLYTAGSETDGDFWVDAVWGDESWDECDPEESLLFSGAGSAETNSSSAKEKRSNRASYSVARGSLGDFQSTVRQQAERDEFNHRVEIRNDTLTRKRLGWNHGGWRLLAGDLDDPEIPIWPAGLPRRTLPRGWRKASTKNTRGLQDVGFDFSAPRPQGFAAAILQPSWKVWAARAWNPVETGDEPPWNSAWNLRHASTGIAFSLPWTVSAQVTETRIARGAADSVAEQLWAGSLASPDKDFQLVGAVSKNRDEKNSGRALATRWHHRFDNSANLDLTLHQRDDAWASSWDPAVTDADAEDDANDGERDWGAGEFRLKGHFPIRRARSTSGEAKTSVDAETRRAWNPAAGTGREGMRGRVDWSKEDVRVSLTGTRRSARATSGSVSVYRYVEAETRLEENPGFPEITVAAFRAWNRSGPTRTGIFLGVEPAFRYVGGAVRATSGLRVETNAEDRLSAQGSVGATWSFARGWNLETVASAPCYPRWEAQDTRWRMTLNYAVTSHHPRAGGDTDSED